MMRDMRNSNDARDESQKHLMVILKGAPERVINRCSKILVKGKDE